MHYCVLLHSLVLLLCALGCVDVCLSGRFREVSQNSQNGPAIPSKTCIFPTFSTLKLLASFLLSFPRFQEPCQPLYIVSAIQREHRGSRSGFKRVSAGQTSSFFSKKSPIHIHACISLPSLQNTTVKLQEAIYISSQSQVKDIFKKQLSKYFTFIIDWIL